MYTLGLDTIAGSKLPARARCDAADDLMKRETCRERIVRLWFTEEWNVRSAETTGLFCVSALNVVPCRGFSYSDTLRADRGSLRQPSQSRGPRFGAPDRHTLSFIGPLRDRGETAPADMRTDDRCA